MGESSHPGDVEQLRATFTSWDIDSRWITTASGPDRRLFLANKGDTTVAAWSSADLAAEMQREDGAR